MKNKRMSWFDDQLNAEANEQVHDDYKEYPVKETDDQPSSEKDKDIIDIKERNLEDDIRILVNPMKSNLRVGRSRLSFKEHFKTTLKQCWEISTSYTMLKLRTKRIRCKLTSSHLMKRTFMIFASDPRSKLLSVKIQNLKGMKTIL